MKNITVKIYVHQSTAIKTGLDTYGQGEVEIMPSQLTQEQRDVLSGITGDLIVSAPTVDAVVSAINNRIAEKTKQEQQAREDKKARRAEQLRSWVATMGTDNQRGRMSENLLPDDEIIDGIRDAAFLPLADFPRYQKLTSSDIPCTCEYESPDASYETKNAESATAGEFDLLQKMRALMPGATVSLREHVGTCDRCEEEVARRSIRVVVTVGELTLSREYAA